MDVSSFQVWLVTALERADLVGPFMRTPWGWPAVESVHFMSLCVLIGTVGVFDLRLMGLARRIPIGALHRLIPFGVGAFAVNVLSGAMFVATEPDQYIYNPAFQYKLAFMALAGLNVAAFYLTTFRKLGRLRQGGRAPRAALVIAAISLGSWLAVIVCGRMITFYRPPDCPPDVQAVVLDCIP